MLGVAVGVKCFTPTFFFTLVRSIPVLARSSEFDGITIAQVIGAGAAAAGRTRNDTITCFDEFMGSE